MPNRRDLPTFLRHTVPVELIARLDSHHIDGATVWLRCTLKRYLPELSNHYGSQVETVWQEAVESGTATIRLDFCTDEIVRLRFKPGDTIPDVQTPMVVGTFDAPVTPTVHEDNRAVTLMTGAIRAEIIRDPWQIIVYDQSRRIIWKTRPVDIDAFMRPEEQWKPPVQRWIFYHRYAYPLGMARYGDTQQVFASFDLRHDEHIYGFGESFGAFDKRGTEQNLWLQEAYGNASPAAYKQVPFYMSSRGYGMYVNTSNALGFHVGDREHTALSVTVDDTDMLDTYFIHGSSFKEILPRYTEITGKPAVPPKWSFGLWMGRISYNRQQQVEDVAHELRERRIPCDVIHIDTDWYEVDWHCDLAFGESKFPDPAGMLSRLREQGFRVSLWQWVNMIVTSSMFVEGNQKGYLAKRSNRETYIYSGFYEDAGFIDYSNPEAVAWLKAKIRALFELGVAAIKTDFGEGAPPDAIYHGVASESMHNLYPLLYNKAIFEVTEDYFGEGSGIVWSRSAWAGSQRYPVHWSGDGVSRFEDLACVLRSALSFGMSGFPFYSHDIGGFAGLPSPELYVRWSQLALFSSHTRAHGVPPREPWAYGEQAEAIFRQYAELRYRLMPYIYSEALDCGATSLPMLRPLVLDYPDDPTVYNIADAYLFGRSLLVAPILDETNQRYVYLPAGEWVDYWTKTTLAGGRWLTVDAALDHLPVYVRDGAIIPYAPLMQYVDERPLEPLTIEIYRPTASGSYVIRSEAQPITVSYAFSNDELIVTLENSSAQVEVVIFGVTVTSAQYDGQPIAVEPLANGGQRIWLEADAADSVTVILAL